MNTFSVKFRAGSLEIDGIVTAYEQHRKFKIELVTDEPDPILLSRSLTGAWTIIQRGSRFDSDQDFESLENAITHHINHIFSAKNMLVLSDFSAAALNAARYAAGLSQQLNTINLLLYHSYESILLPPTAFAVANPEFNEPPEESMEEINRLKSELQQMVKPQTGIEAQQDNRSLIDAVNILIEQRAIGLVVAGVTGKSNLEKILIGSNTLNLVQECTAPLLIVPPQAIFKRIQKVVFACDLKQVSKSVPAYAIKTFIDTLGARLMILNVDQKGANFNPDTIGEMTDLYQLWDDKQAEYHYVDHKDIAKGIMEFADKNAADLVITVPKVYGFFESLFHRNITTKLAYHTKLPLLLFKEDI